MRTVIALVTVVLALFPMAAAQGDSQETKIIALENAWNQAEEHKDARSLDQLLAEGRKTGIRCGKDLP